MRLKEKYVTEFQVVESVARIGYKQDVLVKVIGFNEKQNFIVFSVSWYKNYKNNTLVSVWMFHVLL